MLLVSNRFKYEQVELSSECDFAESVWCKLFLGRKKTLLLGVVYRPPQIEQMTDQQMILIFLISIG